MVLIRIIPQRKRVMLQHVHTLRMNGQSRPMENALKLNNYGKSEDLISRGLDLTRTILQL